MSEQKTKYSSPAEPKHLSNQRSKRYEGKRVGQVVTVTVDGCPLDPRFDLWNHSPTGFEWGYGGSGPAQLALAVLADHLQDDEAAIRLHQDFKFKVVAGLVHTGWALTSEEIRGILVQSTETLHDRPTSMNLHAVPVAVFRLGRIVATPAALKAIPQEDIHRAIQRHQSGDWGDLETVDREANDLALTQGTRILSAYDAGNGTRFWIITEADRSVTTVLVPEDY